MTNRAYEYQMIYLPPLQSGDTKRFELFEKKLNSMGSVGWKVVGTGGSGGANKYESFSTGWVILMREV